MIGEDLELIRRLLSHGAGANLPEPVIYYRLRRASVCTLHRQEAAANRRLIRRGESVSGSRARKTAGASRSSSGKANRRAEATYFCRVGGAALRGARYRAAWTYYSQSVAFWPFQWLAYTGLLRAGLRVGAAPQQRRADLDIHERDAKLTLN
jgi:hypothetical protein